MIKTSMLFCQLDYPQELGTRIDATKPYITIAQAGCALTAVASILANVFHKPIDPLQLNQELITVGGFAANGAGDFDLIEWGAIGRIFAGITVAFNIDYYNPPAGQGLPADMVLIDNQLKDGMSVIVGVSFNHNPNETYPSHYVEIYRKNSDGTYQCRDSMYRGAECDTVFDHRYAVNGMSVANCILQAVSYNGQLPEAVSPAPVVIPPIVSDNLNIPLVLTSEQVMQPPAPEPDVAPIVMPDPIEPPVVPVEPVTEEPAPVEPTPSVSDVLMPDVPQVPLNEKVDALTKDKNNLLIQVKELTDKYKADLEHYTGIVALGFTKAEEVMKKIEEVENENTGLKRHLLQVLTRNKTYHLDMAAKEEEDATAIEAGMKYEYLYKEVRNDLSSIAKVFKTTPSVNTIVAAAYKIRDAYEQVVRQLRSKETKQAVQTAVATVESINTQEVQSSISMLERLITLNLKQG